MKTIKLNIDGFHCVSCALNVDMELEDAEGIIESHTSYAKALSVIEFDESKISEKKIVGIIASLGYKATIR